ncbi:DUF1272 domain-containing protein [Agarivorans aestuarii]|uniref:DUF1272 domain-containing protein n=1 Tax=Agarivorans aestuarii TaxID=1563703 RepID=UPI001C80D22F|nr:DUF1272 domain-containing protein [Agarivorans aestuarii]
MLELRPCCEHCETPLAANATNAMICSFECTFCKECVETVLANVCPNCGGGFCARPIRPEADWVNGNNLSHYPAGKRVVIKAVNLSQQKSLIERVGTLAPNKR